MHFDGDMFFGLGIGFVLGFTYCTFYYFNKFFKGEDVNSHFKKLFESSHS